MAHGTATATASGELDVAGSGVVAYKGHAVMRNASTSADASGDGSHTDMHVKGAKAGGFVTAGSVAGRVGADGSITTTLDWPPQITDASGTISAEAAAVGGAAVGNPLEPAKPAKLAASTSAGTSHSAEAAGEIRATGAAVVAGAAAGNAYADSSLGMGAEGAIIGGLGSYQGIGGIGDSNWYTAHYTINATELSADTDLLTGTSAAGDVTVAGGRIPTAKWLQAQRRGMSWSLLEWPMAKWVSVERLVLTKELPVTEPLMLIKTHCLQLSAQLGRPIHKW